MSLQLDPKNYDLIAIGASTGAPEVITTILKSLPADLSVPIIIAQHMPPSFTKSFSISLDNTSPLSVFHAEDGMPIFPGTVYMGEGRKHIRIKKSGTRMVVEIGDEPADYPYKPSANELFSSMAKVCKSRCLAIVLSGMGSDGCEGAADVKAANGRVITQHKKTCAIYGMPKACDEKGLADASLTPEQIIETLLQFSPQHCSV